jgi:hypothetical protein
MEAFSGLLAHGSAMVSIGEGKGARRTAAAFVRSNYFQTLEAACRSRLLRPLRDPGSVDASPVAIVDEVLAGTLWPEGTPCATRWAWAPSTGKARSSRTARDARAPRTAETSRSEWVAGHGRPARDLGSAALGPGLTARRTPFGRSLHSPLDRWRPCFHGDRVLPNDRMFRRSSRPAFGCEPSRSERHPPEAASSQRLAVRGEVVRRLTRPRSRRRRRCRAGDRPSGPARKASSPPRDGSGWALPGRPHRGAPPSRSRPSPSRSEVPRNPAAERAAGAESRRS